MPPDLDNLRKRFSERNYLFSDHASQRAAERGLLSRQIEEAIAVGEVIEDYPDDKYGPSCLIMGVTEDGLILHIQVSYPPRVKIITVYVPSLQEWESDWKTRNQK
ncbi:MAG: DUF4258 domain-containing protein [Anaerolineae bacterium]|nr:DUF4258 domain-containing protein [Anaerolineae bacterium]